MDPAFDISVLFAAQSMSARRRAEREAASANLELALVKEHMAMLMSQHEPVASLGLDRERLRIALKFLSHGDAHRAQKDLAELEGAL